MSNATRGIHDEEVAATIEALRGSLSIMSPRAALGRSIRITAESVLEAIGNSTYGGGDSEDEDYYDGVYHRPMEVLEAVAETPRPMTARQRGGSLAPRRIAEIDKSYVERWDVSSATAMEFLRSELKIDQLLRSKRANDANNSKALAHPSSSAGPSSRFLGIAPAATLPAASMQEVAALEARCNALQTATGIADDASGNFDEVVVALHKRIQLLDPLYSEEMSNRCDATLTSLKRRATSKTSLFALVGETSADHQKMHQLKELTKVVADAYESIHAALRVVGRLQAMRGVHQEAYFRATSFAQITEEMRLCDALLGSAPDELEEMKPMVADIGLSVKESLAAFRERIKEIPTNKK